jgi:aspartyl-tRNA(Asn)/glutamyl-tRNA(Gln) amidotransferase subunit A
MDITKLTITSTKEGLSKKEFSSVELTKAYLARIKHSDTRLNSFLTVSGEVALEAAKRADALLDGGQSLPLLGVPIALKDIFVTKGIRTTAGSKVLEQYVPQYDGTVVQRLKDAGAVILGKLNCDAWAHGSSGENSDFGATKNPWDTAYVPGGSSSGSAASVAADFCLASTGTDTGGSIRLPASFCNVVGLKPTYGRVSRSGVIAMASSLDSIGHFTKTVEDNALFLQVTAGHDAYDATTPPVAVQDYLKDLKKGVKGLKIGVPKEYFIEGVDSRVAEITKKALAFYEQAGADIVEISLPHTDYAIAVYYIVQTAELSSNLARYDGIRYGNSRASFGDEAKRRIMLGTYVLSAGYYDAYYNKAMKVRTLIRKDFEEAWKKVDVVLTPASPTLPWKLGEKMHDPLKMYLSDIFTVTGNLSGIPGLSIPAGFVDGLPVGIQLLGPAFSEDLLYRTAYAFEQAHDYYLEKPKI